MELFRATLYLEGVRQIQVDDSSHGGYVASQPMQGYTYGPPVDVKPDYKVYKETTCKSVLSEDQKMLVEKVKAFADMYGFELNVINVEENHFLHKLATRLKGISIFPTLLFDTGLKIEGDITEDRIKALLAK